LKFLLPQLSESALYILLTFQVPNLISIFFHLGTSHFIGTIVRVLKFSSWCLRTALSSITWCLKSGRSFVSERCYFLHLWS
jgi:hypothetical protein